MTRAVIVTAWGSAGFSRWFQSEPDDILIAADGGLDQVLAAGLLPRLYVGDGDSKVSDVPEGVEAVHLAPEKDDTDTHHAARLALARDSTEVVLVGGLGGRFSHSLANLHTLAYLARQGVAARMIDEHEVVHLWHGTGPVSWMNSSPAAGTSFSLFAWGGDAKVSLSGAQWPLQEAVLTPTFPVGTSNRAVGDLRLTVHEGDVVLVVERSI